MKLSVIIPSLLGVCAAALPGMAQTFYGDAPDDHHPWAIHDANRPKPKAVTPGAQVGQPPSDAIILFDGKDLSHWATTKEGGGPAKWLIKDGVMEVAPGEGDIRTVDEFGDCQLHIEWAAPAKVEGNSQGRGNSGVFLMGICEVQVLDNYNNPTYADGYAGSVYGVNPPMVNPLRPPGEFQVYDILFRRPIFKDGKEVDPGRVTVLLNGVVVQESTRLEGPTGHMGRTRPAPFPEKGPLKLQDHGNPTRFRNIWYRPLPPRPVEGGTDGYLTTEATLAKRKEIAGEIRADAAKLASNPNPVPYMMRLAESLPYEKDDTTAQKVLELANNYVASIKQLSGEKLAAKKDEVKYVSGAFGYVIRWKALPADFAPRAELEKLIKEQRWDKK